MKEVGKYNLFKGLSLLITSVPTLLVAFSFSDVIVYDSGASISVVALMAISLTLLIFKNKILENFKVPSAFIVAAIIFIMVVIFEQIIVPVKFTALTVMICCGIDEISFKRLYKRIELLLPEKREAYKHFGFYFCKTDTIIGE